jgi:SAM-dependent methyltransferase
MPLSREDIRYGYLYVLGREPESEHVIATYRGQFDTTEEFRAHLLDSEEYRAKNPLSVHKSFIAHLPPEDVDTSMDDEMLRTVVAKTAAYWSKIGIEAPHWSILSTDKFVPSQIEANRIEFYASGALDCGLIRDLLNRAGRSRDEFPCALEFGCGVGRATAHLASAFVKVIAVDISPAHLNLAREHVGSTGARNVEFVQATPENVMPGNGYDLWYSRLVLQHNPPPVTLSILQKAFSGLSPRGVAIVHVRTWGEGYRFKVSAYLKDGLSRDMEMHATPQRAVLALADQCGCRLVEMHEEPGHMDNVTDIFVFEKR